MFPHNFPNFPDDPRPLLLACYTLDRSIRLQFPLSQTPPPPNQRGILGAPHELSVCFLLKKHYYVIRLQVLLWCIIVLLMQNPNCLFYIFFNKTKAKYVWMLRCNPFPFCSAQNIKSIKTIGQHLVTINKAYNYNVKLWRYCTWIKNRYNTRNAGVEKTFHMI